MPPSFLRRALNLPAVWLGSGDRLRAMYAGGKANATARRFARFWSTVYGLGLSSHRWVSLEVPGRASGRLRRFPLGMADWDGEWYLVSMLGERSQWVKNVRASQGHAVLRHGKARPVRLSEVPIGERAPILRSYLASVPGGRPHFPVDHRAALSEFAAVAAAYPVFRITWIRSSLT
jgi:deazaflavin-dependent oxidoreductase (nitroreductase family)